MSISGKFRYGLVFHTAHMCSVNNVNIIGCGAQATKAGILMDGTGSPTDHAVTDCRVFHVGIGVIPFLANHNNMCAC